MFLSFRRRLPLPTLIRGLEIGIAVKLIPQLFGVDGLVGAGLHTEPFIHLQDKGLHSLAGADDDFGILVSGHPSNCHGDCGPS